MTNDTSDKAVSRLNGAPRRSWLQFSIRTLLVLPLLLALSHLAYERVIMQHTQLRLPVTYQVTNFQGTFYEPVIYVCQTPRMMSLLQDAVDERRVMNRRLHPASYRVAPTPYEVLNNPKAVLHRPNLLENFALGQRSHHHLSLLATLDRSDDLDQQLAASVILHLLDHPQGTSFLLRHPNDLRAQHWGLIGRHSMERDAGKAGLTASHDALKLDERFREWLSQGSDDSWTLLRRYANAGVAEAITGIEKTVLKARDKLPAWEHDLRRGTAAELIGQYSSFSTIQRIASQLPAEHLEALLDTAWTYHDDPSQRQLLSSMAYDLAHQNAVGVDRAMVLLAYRLPRPEWLQEMRDATAGGSGEQAAINGLRYLKDPQLNEILFQRFEAKLDKGTPWMFAFELESKRNMPVLRNANDRERAKRMWWRLLREPSNRSERFLWLRRQLILLGETNTEAIDRFETEEMKTARRFQETEARQYADWLIAEQLISRPDAEKLLGDMGVLIDLRKFTTAVATKSPAMMWAPVADCEGSLEEMFWSVLSQIDFSWTVNGVHTLSATPSSPSAPGTASAVGPSSILILQIDGVHYAIRNDDGAICDYANAIDILNTILEHRKKLRRLYLIDGFDGQEASQIVMFLRPNTVDLFQSKFGVQAAKTATRSVDLKQYAISIPADK